MICNSEGNLNEIYTIFNKDINRLLRENEQLRKEVTMYELKELSSIDDVPSSVLHPISMQNSNETRQSRRERGKVVRVDSEGDLVKRSRSLSSHQSSSPEPRALPVELPRTNATAASSAAVSLPTSSYEYQKLLKKCRQLLLKLKQCSQEKASYKSFYEQLKTKERQFILSDKMSSDISQRSKKLTYEMQSMKKSTEQRSSLFLEISNENDQLKQEMKQLKTKQNELTEENKRYLSMLQSQKKVIVELSNEKQRILLFHQFLYKHNHNIHQQRSTSPYKEVYQHFVAQQEQQQLEMERKREGKESKSHRSSFEKRGEIKKEQRRGNLQNSDDEEEVEQKLHNEVSQIHEKGDYQEWLKHHFTGHSSSSSSFSQSTRTAPPAFSRLMYDGVDHRGYSSSRLPTSSLSSSGVKFCPLPPQPTASFRGTDNEKDPFKQFRSLKSSLLSISKT
jgi:myosin heavy subunit